MMGYYNTYGWNSWMLIVMLIWPLVLAAAIWAVVWITRDRAGPRHGLSEETPIEVLKRRFASGDITTEEYLESRAILNNDSSRAVQRP
ncbi:MAG: SHOCT domain-containing protein [Micrococcales bacterium]|nr:SHOCT domain-containing protein [Micrococcales bacterium]